ncbi:MAG TPA: NADH-quinone oxidoreductase subunit L [Cyclobacteriaceae bacterium]|nr:NADH-quinone oxidoreductase subunit L [Cyclobacteriaceae bacterium]
MDSSAPFDLLIGLIVLAPLASFLLCHVIPDRYSWLVTIAATVFLLVSTISSLVLFFSVSPNESHIIQLEWFRVGPYSFNGNLEINNLSVLMMLLVTMISFLVHLYSIGYMAGEAGIRRYFAMLGFFTFSMLGLILSDNLLAIFFCWELVGFSSYLLIGHWLEKPAAAKAAQKAFLFNRIGDVGFLIGLMIVWANTQTFNLRELLHLQEVYSWQTAASLCIFCGVIGKSAQFPLYTWLSDAMEGPIPVSALIHAATMVAAGVFLLARVFQLFTPTALDVVAVVGMVTALLAGISALNQFDIKKILAYSTISQLGLMVTAVGVGSEKAAMFHLVTHALFKACLFLAAGAVIHSIHQAQSLDHENFDAQDIRNMGGLRKNLPTTFLVFVAAAASLAGIPLFAGFLSKDSLITAIWIWSGNLFSWHWMILISAFALTSITVLYTFRMVWFIFFSKTESNLSVTESPWIMRIPLVFLAIASSWLFISINPFKPTGWIALWINELPHSNLVTIISIAIIILSLLFAWSRYSVKNKSATTILFFQQGFQLDSLYKLIIEKPIIKLTAVAETTDRKWIDGVLHLTAYTQVSIAHIIAWFDTYIVDGLVHVTVWLTQQTGSFTRSFQGGKIQLYIFWAVLGLIIFLFFLLI